MKPTLTLLSFLIATAISLFGSPRIGVSKTEAATFSVRGLTGHIATTATKSDGMILDTVIITVDSESKAELSRNGQGSVVTAHFANDSIVLEENYEGAVFRWRIGLTESDGRYPVEVLKRTDTSVTFIAVARGYALKHRNEK